jgi:hypothetical protein
MMLEILSVSFKRRSARKPSKNSTLGAGKILDFGFIYSKLLVEEL